MTMSSSFHKFGIHEQLINQLKLMGITSPTPIQEKCLPLLLSGHDLIAQAQTGTGKTIAFLLAILQQVDVSRNEIQSLILTPTRELAIQITQELNKLALAVGVQSLAAYGGQDIERQLKKLQGSIHVIVATPGRLLDHLRRESLSLGKLQILVLDEADQMLHMGFLPEVTEIMSYAPSRRQTMLFSATMPNSVRLLAQNYMKSPKEIIVPVTQLTIEKINQLVYLVSDRGKFEALTQSILQYQPYLTLVFCRTKRRASHLNALLQEKGFLSDELQGDLSQAKREQVMKRFREAKIQILVATDIVARGIDVEGITHVFNYDIPHDVESYIHRIGRTGRAGQSGVAVTFASPRDQFFIDKIEKGIHKSLTRIKGTLIKEIPKQVNHQSKQTGEKTKAKSNQNRRKSLPFNTSNHSRKNAGFSKNSKNLRTRERKR